MFRSDFWDIFASEVPILFSLAHVSYISEQLSNTSTVQQGHSRASNMRPIIINSKVASSCAWPQATVTPKSKGEPEISERKKETDNMADKQKKNSRRFLCPIGSIQSSSLFELRIVWSRVRLEFHDKILLFVLFVLEDDDECSKSNICNFLVNYVCINSVGSFSCVCRAGYAVTATSNGDCLGQCNKNVIIAQDFHCSRHLHYCKWRQFYMQILQCSMTNDGLKKTVL